MEFTLQTAGASGTYEYVQNGERLAEITWQVREGVMHMDHTYVSGTLRGQGVAKKLLDRAVQYAKEQNYKMKAHCSYVVAAFEKSDAYNDVKV